MEKSVVIDKEGSPFIFDYQKRIFYRWDLAWLEMSFGELKILNKQGDRAFGESIILPGSFFKAPLESIDKDFQRFNMIHQGHARMLSPAESPRITILKLPLLHLGPDQYVVEGRLNQLTQVGGLFKSISSSEFQIGIDGRPLVYYDSVEKKAFAHFPEDAHERDLYKLKLPGNIAEMDPVGHALRKGLPAGFYLLNVGRINLLHTAEAVPFTEKEFARLNKPQPVQKEDHNRKKGKNRSRRR